MTLQTETAAPVRFRPRRLGHANLFVGELERSMKFYHAVVGLDEVCREPGIQAGFLTNGNTHHDVGLMQASGAPRVGRDGHVQVHAGRGATAGLNHFGLEMENEAELVAAYLRARRAGLALYRTTDHQLSHSIYVFDPEGNLLEFYADMMKEWWTVFKPDADLISGHWDPEAAPPTSRSFYHAQPEVRQVIDAIFHPRRVTHAVLVARDFSRMLDFYTNVAGFDEVRTGPDRSFAVLRGTVDAHSLTLLPETPDRPPGLHHVGFEVASDRALDDAVARLAQAGLAPEVTIDHPTKRAVFLRDPDGLRLEFAVERATPFAQRAAGDERMLAFLA